VVDSEYGCKENREEADEIKRAASNTVKQAKKLAKEAAIHKKKSAKTRPVQRKAVKTKVVAKKTIAAKRGRRSKKGVRRQTTTMEVAAPSVERSRALSGGQSGDLQGLSNAARADSESVDELIEEGNAFEADAVAGVEQAGNADEKEVRTHEVAEDGVPEEYLDNNEP